MHEPESFLIFAVFVGVMLIVLFIVCGECLLFAQVALKLQAKAMNHVSLFDA